MVIHESPRVVVIQWVFQMAKDDSREAFSFFVCVGDYPCVFDRPNCKGTFCNVFRFHVRIPRTSGNLSLEVHLGV